MRGRKGGGVVFPSLQLRIPQLSTPISRKLIARESPQLLKLVCELTPCSTTAYRRNVASHNELQFAHVPFCRSGGCRFESRGIISGDWTLADSWGGEGRPGIVPQPFPLQPLTA